MSCGLGTQSHGNRWHKLNICMGAVIGTAGATKAPPSQRDCPLYRVRLLWRPASAVNPGRVIGLSSTPKPPAYSRASRPRSSDCGQNLQAAHRRLQVKKHGGCRLGATMPPPLMHAAFWHGQSVGRQKRCGNCCGMRAPDVTKARIEPYWMPVLYNDVSALNPGNVMASLLSLAWQTTEARRVSRMNGHSASYSSG